jgi:hypothetical protein
LAQREAESKPGSRLADLSTIDPVSHEDHSNEVLNDTSNEGKNEHSSIQTNDHANEGKSEGSNEGKIERKKLQKNVLDLDKIREEIQAAGTRPVGAKLSVEMSDELFDRLNLYRARNRGVKGRNIVLALLEAFLSAEGY